MPPLPPGRRCNGAGDAYKRPPPTDSDLEGGKGGECGALTSAPRDRDGGKGGNLRRPRPRGEQPATGAWAQKTSRRTSAAGGAEGKRVEATGAQGAARNVGRALCARAVQRTINPSNRNRAREREWGESKGISGQIWGLYDDFLAKIAEMAYNTRGDAKQPQWRRVRDLNPSYAINVNTTSSRAALQPSQACGNRLNPRGGRRRRHRGGPRTNRR